MKKTLSYIVLSLLILNAFAQDFSGCDSLWGVWTSFPKEEPFRVVETDVGNFLTAKPYVLAEQDRVQIVPSDKDSSNNYPKISGMEGVYRIIDIAKIDDGYRLLIEHYSRMSVFDTGQKYAVIIYRFSISMHYVDENTCWFESEEIDGKNFVYFKEGKENLYWRERAK